MPKKILNERKNCRVCGGTIKFIADFGDIHINDFPKDPKFTRGTAPMVLDQCEECDLVQMRHTVNPKILYGEHYWYESGLNKKLKDNLSTPVIQNTMLSDKKVKNGKINLVLLKKIGKAFVTNKYKQNNLKKVIKDSLIQ